MPEKPTPTAITSLSVTGEAATNTRANWKADLANFARQLAILKVVTVIGDATVTLDADGRLTSLDTSATGSVAFVTVTDLVGGDLSNVVPPAYAHDAGLLEFHAGQVEKAASILPNNLKLLAEAVEKIFKAL